MLINLFLLIYSYIFVNCYIKADWFIKAGQATGKCPIATNPALVPAHLSLGQIFGMLDRLSCNTQSYCRQAHDWVLEQLTHANRRSQECVLICLWSGTFYPRSPKPVADNKIRAKILQSELAGLRAHTQLSSLLWSCEEKAARSLSVLLPPFEGWAQVKLPWITRWEEHDAAYSAMDELHVSSISVSRKMRRLQVHCTSLVSGQSPALNALFFLLRKALT